LVVVVPAEGFDGHVEVEGFAAPFAADGVGVDAGVAHGVDVAATFGWSGGEFVAVGVDEREPGDAPCLYGPVAFVDEAVVVAAEQYEVVQVGGAAVGPVLDVVAVGVTPAGAAGEPAAPIAYVQGAA
jgi:hypothetical protein